MTPRGDDFYCTEVLSGALAVDVVHETNLGRYQATKHLHWHVVAGDPI